VVYAYNASTQEAKARESQIQASVDPVSKSWVQRLIPIILTTQEAEIGKIVVQASLGIKA
jgi:hypothetical protein